MAQNTKLAGYNAGATPLTGVNPVHTIQFGVCITGRKSTDGVKTSHLITHLYNSVYHTELHI